MGNRKPRKLRDLEERVPKEKKIGWWDRQSKIEKRFIIAVTAPFIAIFLIIIIGLVVYAVSPHDSSYTDTYTDDNLATENEPNVSSVNESDEYMTQMSDIGKRDVDIQTSIDKEDPNSFASQLTAMETVVSDAKAIVPPTEYQKYHKYTVKTLEYELEAYRAGSEGDLTGYRNLMNLAAEQEIKAQDAWNT
jgi:hypothetical protein